MNVSKRTSQSFNLRRHWLLEDRTEEVVNWEFTRPYLLVTYCLKQLRRKLKMKQKDVTANIHSVLTTAEYGKAAEDLGAIQDQATLSRLERLHSVVTLWQFTTWCAALGATDVEVLAIIRLVEDVWPRASLPLEATKNWEAVYLDVADAFLDHYLAFKALNTNRSYSQAFAIMDVQLERDCDDLIIVLQVQPYVPDRLRTVRVHDFWLRYVS